MAAVLDEKLASFQFSGDWTSTIEENLKDILLNTWQDWGFEEIDEEFIIFVLDMIKKRDTMKDVGDEMIGVGLDSTQTNVIIEKFVQALEPYSKAPEVAVKSKVAAESAEAKDPSIDKLLAPLKTSRDSKPKDSSSKEKAPTTSTDKKNINRLLNSALSSARNNDNNNTNSQNNSQQQRKGKRNIHDISEEDPNTGVGGRKAIGGGGSSHEEGKRTSGGANTSNNPRNIKQRLDNNGNGGVPPAFPPYPQGPPMSGYMDPSMGGFPGMMGGAPPPTDPLLYFEHMNQVAIKSGFKNAQEMLSMFQGNMGGPPQYPPHPAGPYPGYPYPPPPYEQAPYQPPYHQAPRPHHAGRFQSGRSNTYVRGGRGREAAGGRGPTDKTTNATEEKESVPKTQVESTPTPEITGSEAAKTEATTTSKPADQGSDHQADSTTEQDQSSSWAPGGRGAGRGGRFAVGRGAPYIAGPRAAGAGGRFAGRHAATAAPATAVFFNPFAQNNNTSLQALASTAAPAARAPFSGGRGRGGGRGAAAGAVANKNVWVRPGTSTGTEEANQT